jgi:O-antigen/teichoic acid export membrane protein
MLNNIELCNWLFLLPVSILLFAVIQVISNWYTRKKYFKILSYCKVIQAVIASVTFVLLGIVKKGTLGLIVGSLAGQLVFILIIIYKIVREESRSFSLIDREIIKEELYENRNFPFYSMPMGFLNAISMNLLIYVLNIFYTATFVGLYAKAIRVIRLPISLLSTSFTSVFYQKLSTTERKIWLYNISYLTIFFIGFILMLPIIFWGEEIFGFVLGSQWIKAGYIAKIIAPLIIFSFATSSVSNVFPVTRTNHILLIWQILYLFAALLIIYIFKSSSIYTLLFYFTLYGSFMYFILAVMGYYILKKRRK